MGQAAEAVIARRAERAAELDARRAREQASMARPRDALASSRDKEKKKKAAATQSAPVVASKASML